MRLVNWAMLVLMMEKARATEKEECADTLSYRARKREAFPNGFPPPYYSPADFPSKHDHSFPLHIRASLFLVNVHSIDATTNSASISWHLKLAWIDRRLAWNFTDTSRHQLHYKPVIYTKVAHIIWAPNLSFDYNALSKSIIGDDDMFATVSPDGEVKLDRTYSVTVSLDQDISQFPVDEQTIYTKLSFRPYTQQQVTVRLETMNLTAQYDQGYRVAENTEWRIRNLSCDTGFRRTDYVSSVYILCRVSVRRKAGYYLVNFVGPSILVTFLGIAGQFMAELRHRTGGSLPPNKTQIALATVMALGVLTIALSQSLPRQSGLTRLHAFYLTYIALTISAFLASALRLPWDFLKVLPPASPLSIADPEAEEEEERDTLALWQWRLQAAFFFIHTVAIAAALAYFIDPK